MIYLIPRERSYDDGAETHAPHHASDYHTECGLDRGTRIKIEADEPPGKYCGYCRNLLALGKAS